MDHLHSSCGRPRNIFASPFSAFAVNLRTFDPNVGLLARLFFGTTSARATNSSNFPRAAARFASCVRCSLAVINNTPSCVIRFPANSRNLSFTAPGNTADLPTSNRNSTAVDTLLTFWPPGPDARTNASLSSELGI